MRGIVRHPAANANQPGGGEQDGDDADRPHVGVRP
jgi:hypothetical protein